MRRLNAVFHLAPSVTLLPEGVRLGRCAGRRNRWFERGLCRFSGTTGENLSFTSENGEFAHSLGSLPSDEVQSLFREITNRSKHPLDGCLRCHMDAGQLLPIGRRCQDMDFVGWGNHTRDPLG